MKTQEQNPNGLHQKYILERTDGTPIHPDNEYFILKVKGVGDPKHIEACKKALAVYAEEVKDHLSELSKDLRDRYHLVTN